MNPTAAVCPPWLATLLHQAGGTVPFRQFMDWALHHPEHGYYGSGRVRIGPQGDFATSPSLGPDFTTLLARQLIDLLRTLPDQSVRLSLVEVGPGEGDLAAELQTALAHLAPDLIERCELVLVERSPALRQRQRQRLAGLGGCPVRWCSIEELQAAPVQGVVLAHELLDAFPVDRLVVHQGELQLQGVVLAEQDQLAWTALSLPSPLDEDLKRSGIELPPPGSEDGWATEWHGSLRPWFASLASAVSDGALLVIDYALEASRYYAVRRADGTLWPTATGWQVWTPCPCRGAGPHRPSLHRDPQGGGCAARLAVAGPEATGGSAACPRFGRSSARPAAITGHRPGPGAAPEGGSAAAGGSGRPR